MDVGENLESAATKGKEEPNVDPISHFPLKSQSMFSTSQKTSLMGTGKTLGRFCIKPIKIG